MQENIQRARWIVNWNCILTLINCIYAAMVVIGYGMYGESFIVTVIVYPVISSVTTFLMVPENIMRRPRTVSARRLGVRREISDFMLNLANKIINDPGNEKHYYLDLAHN
eukprot:697896_1